MKLFSRKKQLPPDPLSAASLVAHASPKKKRAGFPTGKIVVGVLFVFTLALATWLGFQYWQLTQKVHTLPVSGEVQDTALVTRLQGEVGRLIVLPTETPQVVVLSGVGDLASKNKFFAQAHDGDVLLVYPQALQAYVYRPQERILVNVGPIIPQAKPADKASLQPMSLEVRNGTGIPGESKKFIEKLGSNPSLAPISAGDARARFPEAVIVTKNAPAPQIESLKAVLGADVSVTDTIPAGEGPATADITVFLGR